MKITHICLTGIVADGFSYQDNLLSKYHKKLGYEVSFITSKWIFDENGKIVRDERTSYINADGVHMLRLENKEHEKYTQKFKHYFGLYNKLIECQPDIIFIHGVQFLEMKEVVKYIKEHKNVRVYVDNHADFSNSGRNFLSKNILHGLIWRHMAKIIEPYTTKFYGVLPVRVDFLKNVYKLPAEKCELLLMGADDEIVHEVLINDTQKKLQKKLEINNDDFVIVTGGKIDANKLQTLTLMEAVKNIENKKLKLIVFGSVDESIKEKFLSLCDNDRIKYVGWVNNKQSYEYFAIANLIVFPGRHSVYWEQAAGIGIPLLCRFWEGTNHIDLGGNVKFIYSDDQQELKNAILEIMNNKKKYMQMKKVAEKKGMVVFSYKEIAKKSIQK